jgi:hypothetical protein
LLPLPHLKEDEAAPQLRGTEEDVKYRRNDLEGQRPLIPQAAEQVHGQDGLGSGADESGNARRAEDMLQKQMTIGVHSVEDDGNVWKELGDDVESTCSIILSVIRRSQRIFTVRVLCKRTQR